MKQVVLAGMAITAIFSVSAYAADPLTTPASTEVKPAVGPLIIPPGMPPKVEKPAPTGSVAKNEAARLIPVAKPEQQAQPDVKPATQPSATSQPAPVAKTDQKPSPSKKKKGAGTVLVSSSSDQGSLPPPTGRLLPLDAESALKEQPAAVPPATDASLRNMGVGATGMGSNSITIQPGTTEIVPISRNFINRIVTPWASARADTINNAKLKVEGSVVLVSAQGDEPIGLFVADENNPEQAASLQLVPADIPMRDIRLKVGAGATSSGSRQGNSAAAKWETSQPYVVTLLEIAAEVAKGRLPNGYALAETPRQRYASICRMPGFDVRLEQSIEGSSASIHVFAVRNVSDAGREIVEQNCYVDGQVIGVAAWPNGFVEPSQETELYVMTKTQYEAPAESARPRVIGRR